MTNRKRNGTRGRRGQNRRPLLWAALVAAVGLRGAAESGSAGGGEAEVRLREMGRPISEEEWAAWRERVKGRVPARCRVKRWRNGGWALVRPDGTPFPALGIEYEPLALYGGMDWPQVERDLDLLRAAGFNTVTVWCMDFNVEGGGRRRLSFDEMERLAEEAGKRGLYVQFYVLIDRFTDLFPHAMLPDGRRHHFDIDYADPGYREFVGNFARRLAMALYTHDNVNTIVVWEEKVGLGYEDRGARVAVEALYASPAGRARFIAWLGERHGSLSALNDAWGRSHASWEEAVDCALREYREGVPPDDRRQFDVLEFGTVLLAETARVFVEAYRSVDPTMLFQCRQFDLYGPQRAVHPAYGFLDTFGINQYAMGHAGYDLTFREEIVKAKLAAGVTGRPVYVSNFGFRTAAWDRGTHGLVPEEGIKARIGCDTVAIFNWIPEVVGSSYFTYYYAGWEGPWGIVSAPGGAPLPIYEAFRAAHTLLERKAAYVARADYAQRPRVHVFHGLDAAFDLKPRTWIEHTTMSYDLTEMNVAYDVVTDTTPLPPRRGDLLIANFGVYDRKLDTAQVQKLVGYCERGGSLVIGNAFGARDRYLRPDPVAQALARRLRGGLEISEPRRGAVTVILPGGVKLALEDASYVLAPENYAGPPDGDVLMWMEAEGRRQPGLISRRAGRGWVYYFLFNPYFQRWYGENVDRLNRTSLPILSCLLTAAGISHDKRWGNRGFDLASGRVNVHEKPIHFMIAKEAGQVGATCADEYGEPEEAWSGGVFTDEYLAFRGRRVQERGWEVEASEVTSLAACVADGMLSFFTSDPVSLWIRRGGVEVWQRTEPYRVYSVSGESASGSRSGE